MDSDFSFSVSKEKTREDYVLKSQSLAQLLYFSFGKGFV